MPLPSDHPVLRWQYSLASDDLFDDGREPRAAALIGHHWQIPELTWADPPDPAAQGRGCWWYPQDLAAAPVTNAVAVLSVAARLGALAIVDRRILAEAPEVRLLHEIAISLPRSTSDALSIPDSSLASAKCAVMNLLDVGHGAVADDLRTCKAAIDELASGRADRNSMPLSLGIAEFPYIDSPGGRSKRRRHPVAVFDALAVSAPSHSDA